jgi:hypothetical protein
MTEIQLLNNSQIENILDIIKRDYINPQLEAKREEILVSDNYMKVHEEIVTSKEYKEELIDLQKEYKTNLEVASLYRKLKDIDTKYTRLEDSWGGTGGELVNWLVNATDELILDVYNEELDSLKQRTQQKALIALDINISDWSIRDDIKLDLRTRLQLIAVTDLDSIITAMIPFIQIDKYLYTK